MKIELEDVSSIILLRENMFVISHYPHYLIFSIPVCFTVKTKLDLSNLKSLICITHTVHIYVYVDNVRLIFY